MSENTQLSELKQDIKCWERMFQRQNGRKPTKSDIKVASSEIQTSYKDYSELKHKLASQRPDVFGLELNKKEPIISEEAVKPKFVLVTPHLRKKIIIKEKENTCLKDDDFINNLGIDSNVSLIDSPKTKPAVKTFNSNFFKKSASNLLKSLDNNAKVPEERGNNIEDAILPERRIERPKTPDQFDVFDLQEDDAINSYDKPSKPFVKQTKMVESAPYEPHVDKTYDEVPKASQSVTGSLEINPSLLNAPILNPAKKRKKEPEVAEKEEDGNFVRLDMRTGRKKRYVKTAPKLSGEAYKRKQWKSRGLFGKGPPKDFKNPDKKPPKVFPGSKNSKPGKCFKCGEEGHWSNKCPGKVVKEVKELTPEEKVALDELDFSSLEPMMMAKDLSGPDTFTVPDNVSCPPLLDGTESEEHVNELLSNGLRDIGYTDFRPGQRDAVLRTLSGKNTLLVLSTGGGKSLVYQLAAYLYWKHCGAVALVISPLISLMDDQIQSLPPALPGKCIHSHMSVKQRQAVKEGLIKKEVPIVLLSPEALMVGNYGSLPSVQQMPPISFVCIDEAHCLSSWSDNFRPSYLRVCDVLRMKYGVSCFLGLTATCTAASAKTVCKFIGVDDEEKGVIKGPVIRENLYMSASFDQQVDRALVSLLKGSRFAELGSIIVYCTRREQCERVAALLRTSLPLWAPEESELIHGKNKRKRKGFENSTAEAYHAGLSPNMRGRVQHHFMAGTLRIVCATVAFGMGLDKANVRSVIHYSMPKSFENYVQEIGRAGRDGRPAHCHVFVDEMKWDLYELSRHAHSNTVDRYSVQQLLNYVFKPCACAALQEEQNKVLEDKIDEVDEFYDDIDWSELDQQVAASQDNITESQASEVTADEGAQRPNVEARKPKKCPGHSVTFPMERLVQDVDVPVENITTMLTYLELSPERCWLTLKQPVNATCHIQCYGGPAHLAALAKQATTVLAAVKFYANKKSATNEVEFPYIELAAKMGWEPFIVRRELKELPARSIPGFGAGSGISVEFKDLSFHVKAVGDLSDDDRDRVCDYLYGRVAAQKNAEVRRLKDLHAALLSVAISTHYDAAEEINSERDLALKEQILAYFTSEGECANKDWANKEPELPNAAILASVIRDIRGFAQKYADLPLRGRVIARIMQGISSPNYPALTWGRLKQYWRKHIDVDFDWMVKCATNEIATLRLN